MKSVPKRVWIVLGILCFAGILQATVPLALISNWTATTSLAQARANSAAVMLSDGSNLFTGGDRGGNVLQTAEVYGVNGNVTSVAAMNVPRSKHFAVVLGDGRVLVGGGNTSGGGTTNSAEIYDPSANVWTQTGPMTSARANATAALLQDGRVLIAGGDNAGTPSNTIEIYDPASGIFTFAGILSSARTQHAIAVLQDGRVLIVGGFDGNNPLASSDIFDPVNSTITAGPSLNTARYSASATTLMSGQVAIVGGAGQGSNGTVDLASIEIFDPTTNSFSDAGVSMNAAREGQQAFLLPNNNNVLIVGGTSGGTALASAELITPQVSPSAGTWAYTVSSTGSLTAARAGASGSANQVNGPTSAVQKPGLIVVAGGSDASGNALSSTEVYGYATLQTDQSDYPPGTTVTISGSGFKPDETVNITLVESPLIDTHGPYAVLADGNGNFTDSSFTTDVRDVNVRFWLSAVGSQSGLQVLNTFTDGNVTSLSGTVNSSAAGNPPIVGATITCTGGCNNTPPASTTSGAGGAYGFNNATTKLSFNTNGPVTLQLTASASGFNSSTITVNNVSNGGTLTGENFTLTPNVVTTSTTVTTSGTPSTYGSSVTFTAQVHATTGSTAPTGTVTFTIDGTPGSAVALGACSPPSSTDSCAILSTSSLKVAASPHSVSANYTHTGNFADSSGSLSGGQTVNALPITATLAAQDKTYDGTATEPNASMNCLLAGVLVPDAANVSCTATNGTFNGSTVGSHTVSATVTISGSAAGNYTLGAAGTSLSSTTASASANITTRAITATLTAQDKVYDGTNTEPDANMSCSFSGVLAADAANVSCTPSNGTFNTSQVATANQVNATVTIGAAGNYTLGAAGSVVSSTSATATARIKTAPLTATLTAADKVYDGTSTEPNANMTCSFSGVVASDAGSITCTPTNGTFNTSQVATANQVTATVTIGGSAAGNYTTGAAGSAVSSTSATTTAHIKTAPLTATLTAADKVYDATTTEPNANMSCSFAGVVASDAGNVSCSATNGSFNSSQVAGASQVNATVTINGTAAGNYTLGAAGTSVSSTGASATAHIKTTPLTATLTAADKIYDGATTEPDANMSCSFTGVVASDASNVTCTPSSGAFNTSQVATATQVTGTVTLGGSAGGNYTLGSAGTSVASTSANAVAHIKTAPLTATLIAQDKIYDGTTTEPDANMTCSFNGVIASDTNNISCTASNGSFNAPQVPTASQVTATVTLGGGAGGNYTLGAAGTSVASTSAMATAHIKTAPLSATLTAADKMYAGNMTEPDANMSCSFAGVIASDNTNISCVASNGAFNSKDVLTANQVTATVTIGGSAAGNYTLGAAGTTVPSTSATASAHITPKPVTARITASDKMYDGNATQSDANMHCALAAGSAVGTDDVGCIATNGTFNSAQVLAANTVTAAVSLTGTTASNYSLTSASASAPAHITPKSVTAMLTAADKIYDGNATEPDPSMHCALLAGSAVDTDDVSCVATNGSFNGSQVLSANNVTASVALAGTTLSNYSLTSATGMASAHITPKAVTVSFTAADRNYDATTVAAVLNCSIATGKVGVDDLTCTVANGAFASKDAGPNPQTVSATATLTGAAASNYSVANPVTTTAAISPAPITVTADPQTKIFGQVDPSLTYKVMNGALNTLFSGDSFSGVLSRATGENVGTYAILQGALTAGTNYTISYVGANLNISRASSATVVVSSPSPSVFGQSVSFTATVTDATPGSTGTPTGSVQFFIDGVLSGTASLNVSGQVSIMTGALAVGGHTVHAKYLGDQNFIGSTSADINQTVNKANTSVAVATSGSPSTLNAPVKFTATITVVSPGAGMPTGTVTFYLDSTSGTQLGTAAISGGTAFITTSAVPVNSHTIVALYSGDGSFNTSSGSVTQLVQYASSGACAGDVGHAIRQPINQDGSSVWKSNATVPAKFAVCDANGVSIGTPGTASAFNLIAIVKGTVTTSVNEAPDSTTPDNAFRWDPTAQQWIFNISTKSAPVNVPNETYVFKILLNDGSNITFQFGLR